MSSSAVVSCRWNGGPVRRADVAITGEHIVAVEDPSMPRHSVRSTPRVGSSRRVSSTSTRISMPSSAGTAADVVVLARHHERRTRELRGHVRSGGPGRARVARRDDGERRGHPSRGDPRRPSVGLVDIRGVPRLARPDAEGPQRRRDGRPCAVRVAAMGERSMRGPGRPRRHRLMCELVEEAMRAGALGFSTAHLGHGSRMVVLCRAPGRGPTSCLPSAT